MDQKPQTRIKVQPLANTTAESDDDSETYDCVVIGGGQAGLATGYFLQQTSQRFCILEANSRAVGSWPHYYDSLRLFSPRRYSGLPGMRFPGEADGYPLRNEVIEYLESYRHRFNLPVRTSQRVARVERQDGQFRVQTKSGECMTTRSVVVCSGPHNHPTCPELPRQEAFQGQLLHSYDYVSPDEFAGKNIVVVGAKNSAVQIAHELAQIANVTIASRRPIRFVNHKFCGVNIYWWEKTLGVAKVPLGWSRRIRDYMNRKAGVIDSGRYRQSLKSGVIIRRPMFANSMRMESFGTMVPENLWTRLSSLRDMRRTSRSCEMCPVV